MCERFTEWSADIQSFCKENNLSFEKAKKSSKSWGKDFLILAHHDPEKGKTGLLDDTPMPAVLLITKEEDGNLVFETTEFTEKYLRNDEKSEPELQRKIG